MTSKSHVSGKRSLIVYIASSLDGYIAAPGDDLGFLDKVQEEGEDYGYTEFISGIDTVIMGRRTYEWVIGKGHIPHPDKECFVLSRKGIPTKGNAKSYSGSLISLIETLKSKDGKNIFCDGGADIIHQLLNEKVVDKLIISIVPVLLGDGIRLFNDDRPMQELKLIGSKAFRSGLVQLHYKVGQ